jgi:ABC-type transport system involved in multi-copper enzyme maturation permease subunit
MIFINDSVFTIISYNKNRDALISLINFGIEHCMFQTGLLSISIACTAIARSGWNNSSILILLAASQHNRYDKYLLLCVQY